MLRHLGYVAITLSIDATTNRTCRLRNATPEHLRNLIRLNLQALMKVLEFNARNDIFLYRISSQIIPFASHPVNSIPWWDEFGEIFVHLGRFIRENGFRVSMHPGQFTVLNSPNPAVVTTSIKEIEWHNRLLDCLDTDADSKIVVHVGGRYGDKASAAQRFVSIVQNLPERDRSRLVVENNERDFTAEDVLAIAHQIDLPVVFDWLHHRVNPGITTDDKDLLRRIFSTWRPQDGLPKVHFSSQAEGGKQGQHAEWVNPNEFVEFLSVAPSQTFDCMLEAKGKDLALFRLRKELADTPGLEPKRDDNWAA